jgi:hypothetical protein
MKEETEAAVIGITPDTLGIVAANFQSRLQMMIDASGSYTEYIFQ